MNRKIIYVWLAAAFSLFCAHSSFGQGTAFLYQGQLDNAGAPANGDYDFQFTLYNAASGGVPASGSLTNEDVAVSNGLFTVTLDFGAGVFTGPNLWLDIGVRPSGTTNFTMLSPLQPVLPTPYAIFANSASNLIAGLPASQINGTLPATAFEDYTNTVALTNAADQFAGSFSGNGADVTNVDVTNLTGVLADSQLPVNTAYLNSNQTFTANNTFNATNTFNGVNTFTNLYGNSFSGSFFGNGLVGWIVVTGTTVQASIDHGYLLTNSQVVTVTLPTNANPGDIVRVACAGASGWQLGQNAGQSVLGNFLGYGSSWSQSEAGALAWSAIASSSDGTKMAATASAVSGGGIYVSTDSGQTWSATSASSADWSAIASSADGTYLAACVEGGDIYVSTNSGSSWTAIGDPTGLQWFSLAYSSDGTKLVAGVGANATAGDIYTFQGTALVNTFSTSKEWASVASSANGTNLIAAAYGGDLYTSTDAGTAWSAVTTSGLTSKDWRAVASSSDGSKLAAAIYGGGIYTSVNYGQSWTSNSAPSEDWISLASSSDGSKLAAVVEDGGIYTSSNWGMSWTAQTNAPTAAYWSCVASSANAETLAATVNNSGTSGTTGIYTSTAASETLSTTGTNGYISGGQGSAVELQYIGNNQFMPASFSGTIWAN